MSGVPLFFACKLRLLAKTFIYHWNTLTINKPMLATTPVCLLQLFFDNTTLSLQT